MNQSTFNIPIDIASNVLFGVQNKNVEFLQSYFSKLKLVARDNIITVFGNDEDVKIFEQTLNKIFSHINTHNSLDLASLSSILISTQDFPKEPNKDDIIVYGTSGKAIRAITAEQRNIVNALQKNDMAFILGSAGTGKTYISVALAVKALREKVVKRIILTRPAVEAGENLGFLPGDLKEKLAPYMQPLYDALADMIPAEKLKYYMENRVIEIAPLAFMRGRTLDEAFVILDEAQNTTHLQMKMFLTRMGRSAKFIITGDIEQIDLPKKITSGLVEAAAFLKDVKGISMIHLNSKDLLRHSLVKDIVEAYRIKEPNHD